jgi:dolichol-phosphate mannosyltransferase
VELPFKKESVVTLEEPEYSIQRIEPKRSDTVLIIPVINEGERILNQLRSIRSGQYGIDLVLVDGGSTDGSQREFLKPEFGISVLLTKMSAGGLSTQLRIAFKYCLESKYKYIITMDGNNKDDPSGIPQIESALKGGCDFVQGSRFIVGGMERNTPKTRLLAIKLIHAPLISIAAKFKFTDSTNGFRGFSSKFLITCHREIFQNRFAKYELLAYMPVLASQRGFKCAEVPVIRAYPNTKLVPTKISGIQGYFELIQVLWKVCFKKFDI